MVLLQDSIPELEASLTLQGWYRLVGDFPPPGCDCTYPPAAASVGTLGLFWMEMPRAGALNAAGSLGKPY